MPKRSPHQNEFIERVLNSFLSENKPTEIVSPRNHHILYEFKTVFTHLTDEQKIIKYCQDYKSRYINNHPKKHQIKTKDKKRKKKTDDQQDLNAVKVNITTSPKLSEPTVDFGEIDKNIHFRTELFYKTYNHSTDLASKKYDLITQINEIINEKRQELEECREACDKKAEEIVETIDNILNAKITTKNGDLISLRQVFNGDLAVMNGVANYAKEAKTILTLLELQYKYVKAPIYHCINELQYFEKSSFLMTALSASRFDDMKAAHQAGAIEQALSENGMIVAKNEKDNVDLPLDLVDLYSQTAQTEYKPLNKEIINVSDDNK